MVCKSAIFRHKERLRFERPRGSVETRWMGNPHILFITADQMRADELGQATPHLNRLARRGLRFANCYCAAPLCQPSRSSIITGRDPTQHGFCGNMNEPVSGPRSGAASVAGGDSEPHDPEHVAYAHQGGDQFTPGGGRRLAGGTCRTRRTARRNQVLLGPPHTGLDGYTQRPAPLARMGERRDSMRPSLALATLGAGCFWCVEAVYRQVRGVRSAVPGYSGGALPEPTYEQVCTGTTGHAEVVQIEFDSAAVGYSELLEIFFRIHDPTTPNRQGADVGAQYRSVIFYHDEAQRGAAETARDKAASLWADPIVTELSAYTGFYRAEDHHMDYFARNPCQPYCRVVIDPKVRRFQQDFGDRIAKRRRLP